MRRVRGSRLGLAWDGVGMSGVWTEADRGSDLRAGWTGPSRALLMLDDAKTPKGWRDRGPERAVVPGLGDSLRAAGGRVWWAGRPKGDEDADGRARGRLGTAVDGESRRL